MEPISTVEESSRHQSKISFLSLNANKLDILPKFQNFPPRIEYSLLYVLYVLGLLDSSVGSLFAQSDDCLSLCIFGEAARKLAICLLCPR